ncbi:hemerythrin [Caloramator quimbayensis]|uniref:Bacteriohemerythrin n=1 Tax=Caloramator quimbayensis TaxID=1147123 RepID=A0A1T4WGI6_9CLOT|nr:bacteriohemerythrin [Caloramator quimbayensis]SKA75761.1 hemerythrin [Caloramator quimbayensis]
MIVWKDEYSIGVEHIDNQHRHLVEIANKAYDVLENQFYTDKYDKIAEILDELKGYTVLHFRDEEELMTNLKYKKFLSHKVEHDDFINKVKSIDLEKVDLNQEKYLLDIVNFIVDWLVSHIIEKDKLITQDNL